MLLAVDLGLRSGLALYGRDGRLCRARSTNFGTLTRLKRGAPGVLAEASDLAHLVVEGDTRLAEIWEKAATRVPEGARPVTTHRVSPERWRERLLHPRQRRSGEQAKDVAGTLAREVFVWSGLSPPTSLRHDAAEAVLIGLWGVLEVGWLDELPRELGGPR